jgi:hypothetical protein
MRRAKYFDEKSGDKEINEIVKKYEKEWDEWDFEIGTLKDIEIRIDYVIEKKPNQLAKKYTEPTNIRLYYLSVDDSNRTYKIENALQNELKALVGHDIDGYVDLEKIQLYRKIVKMLENYRVKCRYTIIEVITKFLKWKTDPIFINGITNNFDEMQILRFNQIQLYPRNPSIVKTNIDWYVIMSNQEDRQTSNWSCSTSYKTSEEMFQELRLMTLSCDKFLPIWNSKGVK